MPERGGEERVTGLIFNVYCFVVDSYCDVVENIAFRLTKRRLRVDFFIVMIWLTAFVHVYQAFINVYEAFIHVYQVFVHVYQAFIHVYEAFIHVYQVFVHLYQVLIMSIRHLYM